MIVIFCFSAQPAERSSGLSGGIAKSIACAVDPNFQKIPTDEQERVVEKFQHLTRKLAHFSEYAVLGALCFLALSRHRLNPKLSAFLGLGISALYGVTDELHQLFVPGRSCQVGDIAIDTMGAIVGILIAGIIFELIRRRNRKRYQALPTA